MPCRAPAGTWPRQASRLLPGMALAAAIAALGTVAGGALPVVGAPAIAILIGIGIASLRQPSAALRPGVAFTAKRVLQGSIVVLGLGLTFTEVISAGRTSLPVLLGTLLVGLAAAWLIGRALRLRTDLTLLIGIGTAICGASAIAATDSVIDAEESDVSYAIATIFAFNVAAVLLYPSLGHALGMSQRAFGLWAGTAINDTSSVVAASTIFGRASVTYGVVVKLTRTLAIVPICLALATWRARRPRSAAGDPRPAVPTSPAPTRSVVRHVVPFFVLGFVVAVALHTAGAVPTSWHHPLADVATWMITAALAAVGLSTDVAGIRAAGPRPLFLGASLWVTVGVTSLIFQAATGTI